MAAEAGVSEQTVYRVFGNKASLLHAVILTAVGGPDDPQVLRDSPRMALMSASPTPADRLRVVAGWAREAYERGLADLENMVAAAAPADDRLGQLVEDMALQSYEDTRSFVLAILGDAGAPSGIEVEDIVDYVWAVESTSVYWRLVSERGWTTQKYVEWFVDLFERMFLDRIGEATD